MQDIATAEKQESRSTNTEAARRSTRTQALVFDLLLIGVLLIGAYFRVTGLFWGEKQFLHPDERFLLWVGADISPIKSVEPAATPGGEPQKVWISLADYFDTANSPLNPHNRGHGFYVYGTLPMFLARYAVEWVFGQSGFVEMSQVGRALSAMADLLVVVLVYMVADRLYDRRVAILAAAFSAAAVLQIQQSHFFTMDTFVTLFTLLAFYFAVRVLTGKWGAGEAVSQPKLAVEAQAAEVGVEALSSGPEISRRQRLFGPFFTHPLFLPSLGFGLALGMAVSSKLNAAPIAVVLPAAMLIRLVALPSEKRERLAVEAFTYLVMAAVISVIVFRIAQPYAFSGPGFFGIKPNPQWVANIREQRAQSSGDVDFPPAMQWARRSVLFSGQNMVLWGLGLPLGVLAWAGFLWAGWRMLKGDWQRHALIWGWTGAYFVWQSMALNPTMRYQLLIYPMLAIFAGWAVVSLWDLGQKRLAGGDSSLSPTRWPRVLAVLVGGAVLLSTYAYAYAFSGIYTRPITRLEASRWIFQNIPGPINLRIQEADGEVYNQPLAYPYYYTLTPFSPYNTAFQPKVTGRLSEITLSHLRDLSGSDQPRTLTLTLSALPDGEQPLAQAILTQSLLPVSDPRGDLYTVTLDQPVPVVEGQLYYLRLDLVDQGATIALDGELVLRYGQAFLDAEGVPVEQRLPDPPFVLPENAPYVVDFIPQVDGELSEVYLPQVSIQGNLPAVTLRLIVNAPDGSQSLAESTLAPQTDGSGQGLLLTLDQPVVLSAAQSYTLSLQPQPGGAVTLSAPGIANESDWDDAAPWPIEGYSPYGGIYPLDQVFQMYWDDTPEKLERFLRILNESEYITITSSRQWGSLTRIPERFPLTTLYYRNLIGCPEERDIEWCYNVAEPGDFEGSLGFELIKVFKSYPTIGPIEINDQFAEEAFTVYDHPKVFIFRKSADYDPQQVQALLSSVDFSQVVRTPPMRIESRPANLLLPTDRLAQQRQGGTWAQLFDMGALYNRYPALSAVLWYLSVGLLGLIAYPVLRLALPGLPDKGYPLARTAGLLLVSYLAWIAGSFRVPFTRPTITVIIALAALFSLFLAYRQRGALREELRRRGRYFLLVEGLFLAFFLIGLLLRLGNPDLWHPIKGGEKPMDFAYLNAVLKSTSFPPYDPWFAGGYLNYYYFGFVFVGTLVKWLGIVPSVAYNLILPTVFSLIALGAFSIGWNLFSRGALARSITGDREAQVAETYAGIRPVQVLAGLAGALGMALLGNLGVVRLIVHGYQRLVAPVPIEEGNLLERAGWTIQGLIRTLGGDSLPVALDHWYWNPSRAIPGQGDIDPITEFPFFTVLYGDPHAHLFALPIALLVLSFALGVLLGRARWRSPFQLLGAFILGGLAIGALRPTNTWDFYPYLAVGVVIVGYSFWSYFETPPALLSQLPALRLISSTGRKVVAAGAAVLLLVGLSFVLYQPYGFWYGQGYNEVALWEGTQTPVASYLTHWGLFLFIIAGWMAWETREWLDSTPLSSLRKLEPVKFWIQIALLLLLAAVLVLVWIFDVSIAWLALPLAAWAGVLILRPDQPDAKRFALFLVGTALTLTLMVELIVLVGDISRMNTVFKFYLQAWTMLAVSAAAAFGWLLLAMPAWLPGWRRAFSVGLAALVFGAALFPLLGGTAKIKDRWWAYAPHTLDGMAYMEHNQYDYNGPMDLGQDYAAIRWMQENVPGSPVIVETSLRSLYLWGSRFSIYTGLPTVVGWEWHQQQQRAVTPASWVTERIFEVDEFYDTTDTEEAMRFLRKYDVRYIIVGQLERHQYNGPGMDKFEALDGIYWNEVFRNGETAIYEVNATPLTAN